MLADLKFDPGQLGLENPPARDLQADCGPCVKYPGRSVRGRNTTHRRDVANARREGVPVRSSRIITAGASDARRCVVLGPLAGRESVGLYLLLHGDACRLLVCDFDGASWTLDALAYVEVCRNAGVPAVLERSRSGDGAHVWVFFSANVAASIARMLGAGVLRGAMEQTAAALEVMSRFAADPRWLVYLPPTMAPPATSSLDGYLEHPAEAFALFRSLGIERVVCERSTWDREPS